MTAPLVISQHVRDTVQKQISTLNKAHQRKRCRLSYSPLKADNTAYQIYIQFTIDTHLYAQYTIDFKANEITIRSYHAAGIFIDSLIDRSYGYSDPECLDKVVNAITQWVETMMNSQI
jgi:hypothetical protein